MGKKITAATALLFLTFHISPTFASNIPDEQKRIVNLGDGSQPKSHHMDRRFHVPTNLVAAIQIFVRKVQAALNVSLPV